MEVYESLEEDGIKELVVVTGSLKRARVLYKLMEEQVNKEIESGKAMVKFVILDGRDLAERTRVREEELEGILGDLKGLKLVKVKVDNEVGMEVMYKVDVEEVMKLMNQ